MSFITTVFISGCPDYSGDILKDKGTFLSVFLLTKTDSSWKSVDQSDQEDKEKNHKGQLLWGLNDISHLANKNFQVLQAAPCPPWKGIKKGSEKEKLKTHEAYLNPDSTSSVCGKKSQACASLQLC